MTTHILQLKQDGQIALYPPLTSLESWRQLDTPAEFVGKFGISNLPCVPLRAAPSDAAEMEGQLLFGEALTVLEADKGCLKVQRLFRNPACRGWGSMSGWIDDHVFPAMMTTEQESQRCLNSATGYVAVHTAEAFAEDGRCVKLPFGSILPDFSVSGTTRTFRLGGQLYEIRDSKMSVFDGAAPRTQANLLQICRALDGVQYLWGGQTSWGMDCSGFTQSVLRVFGLEVPRNASEQIHVGPKIDVQQTRTGDLAFFGSRTREKPGHVGIIIRGSDGALAMFHAKQRVKCQLLVAQPDDPQKVVYPESVRTVEMKAITRPVEFD